MALRISRFGQDTENGRKSALYNHMYKCRETYVGDRAEILDSNPVSLGHELYCSTTLPGWCRPTKLIILLPHQGYIICCPQASTTFYLVPHHPPPTTTTKPHVAATYTAFKSIFREHKHTDTLAATASAATSVLPCSTRW